MKKKILFVITKGNFGGAQRYVYDLATSLPQKGFVVMVACGNKDGSVLTEKLREKGIKTITLEGAEREIKAKNDFRVWWQIVCILKEERPDIVHLNSSKIAFLGALAILYFRILNLFRLPVRSQARAGVSNFEFRALFTAHGWAFNEKSRPLSWKIIYWISYYFTVLVTDKTIAVSEKTRRDIGFLPFLKNKILVIHNGIDKFEQRNREEARNILEVVDKITLLSIGELHQSKGFDIALKAISLLPVETREKIAYRIIGGGEEKEKLEKMIVNLRLEENVKLLGLIENAKKLLAGADIALFPSRNENLPYVLLEAGLAGLPVIATNVGGVPEVMRDMEEGILVHKESPKEIVEAIKYLLSNPQKCLQFGRALKARVSHNFSSKKMLEKTIAVYDG